MIAQHPTQRLDATSPVAEMPGGRPSFAEVYEEHFAFVWRSARRLGAPPSTVEDVVQEIFVVVHRRLDEFEGRSSMKRWLFGIVLNVVRAHRRMLLAKHPHAFQREATDPDTITDKSSGPEDAAVRADTVRVVDELLDTLDDDKRAVFVLAELEQMSAPEIAAILGIPLNTVYSRLRLGRQEFAAAAARYRARDERRAR